jgi:hypothetical protein
LTKNKKKLDKKLFCDIVINVAKLRDFGLENHGIKAKRIFFYTPWPNMNDDQP